MREVAGDSCEMRAAQRSEEEEGDFLNEIW